MRFTNEMRKNQFTTIQIVKRIQNDV